MSVGSRTKHSYIVQKFGGESVDDTRKVWEMLESGGIGQKLAVVSAFSGVTNDLFSILAQRRDAKFQVDDFVGVVDKSLRQLHHLNAVTAMTVRAEIAQVLAEAVNMANGEGDLVLKEDIIIGLGERISARVVAAHANELGSQDKYQAVDLADLIDPLAEVAEKDLFKRIEAALLLRIQPILAGGKIPVITGYMGRLPGGTMKLMDRGYSDSTLVLVARALATTLAKGKRVRADICKTVFGLLSADPKAFDAKNPPARHDQCISTHNRPTLRAVVSKGAVARLAGSGMKAVNAKAASLLQGATAVDGVVRHTFHPEREYTVILDELPKTLIPGIRVITHKVQSRLEIENTSALDDQAWIARILQVFAQHGLSVNVVESATNTCTVLIDENSPKLKKVAADLMGLGQVNDKGTGMVSVGWLTCVEDGKRSITESNRDLATITQVLSSYKIDILGITCIPGQGISLMVKKKDMIAAVRYLHKHVVVRD